MENAQREKLEEQADWYLRGVYDGIGHGEALNDIDRGAIEEHIIAQLMEPNEEIYKVKLLALHMVSIKEWKP